MSYLDREGIPRLALDFIDHDHEEAARLASEIKSIIDLIRQSQADNDALSPLLEALLTSKQAHFKREEEAMSEANFPAYQLHRQEHCRVINELTSLIDHWKTYADLNALNSYMTEIFPTWLKSHTVTMDEASVRYIKGR